MQEILRKLGIEEINAGVCTGVDGWIRDENGAELRSVNPASNETIATVIQATASSYERAVDSARAAFPSWRLMPAPKRGELIRDLGNALREYKEPLGELVTLENGKIRSEGLGEVQEMIDICDFAVGPLPPALRSDDALGTARPSHVRAMASAGTDRHYHRLQLSSGGLVMECGDRGRLWRYHDLEAVTHHAINSHCRAAYLQSCHGQARR